MMDSDEGNSMGRGAGRDGLRFLYGGGTGYGNGAGSYKRCDTRSHSARRFIRPNGRVVITTTSFHVLTQSRRNVALNARVTPRAT